MISTVVENTVGASSPTAADRLVDRSDDGGSSSGREALTVLDHEPRGDGVADPEQDPLPVTTFAVLEQIVTACASNFAPQVGRPSIYVSVGVLAESATVPVELVPDRVVDFLNACGPACGEAGLVDVQFSLTKRTSKAAKDLEAIYGVTVDVDEPSHDILGEVERAGIPVPTFTFPTANGSKLGYVAARPLTPDAFEEQGMRLTLAFPAGDPRSWDASQMQRLPTVLKMTDDGVVALNFRATVTNAVPLEPSPTSVRFPLQVLTKLGADVVSAAERKLIDEFLEEQGIPAPECAGSILYAACPVSEVHSSKCCYVNRTEEGATSAHCLSDHGGEGPKRWSERDLLALAAGSAGNAGVARFNPLRHLPVTPWAVRYIQFVLRDWPAAKTAAVVHLWQLEWARYDARGLVPEADVLAIYRDRLKGIDGLRPMAPYFERSANQLMHEDPLGRIFHVTGRQGLGLKTNATELKATALWRSIITQTDNGTQATPGWCLDAQSLTNKLAVGHADVLAKAGVPAITTYASPVAHVEESWAINPRSFNMEAVVVRDAFSDVDEVDAVAFFLDLFHAGRLPLASENDVLLFVMLLATPLLRHIAPGQLGVFWIVGASGAGKDFLAELARDVWAACTPGTAAVSFDLNLAGDLELKRSLEMSHGCIFARAKEAGKRPGLVEILIRLAGTDMFTVRGLNKDEVNVRNTFTFVAESAENLPDRREISRRTVAISVAFMRDEVSKGEIVRDVRAAAKGLLKNLKRIAESKRPDWYMSQANTGSRPLVPAALAKLFGATLPAVEGEDLTDIFETMATFVRSAEGFIEGAKQLAIINQRRADKASLESKTLPSYRLSLFIEEMSAKPGNAELFWPYARKSQDLVNRIVRESEYRTALAKMGYMPIHVQNEEYALRIEDKRRFIFMPEVDYTTKMATARTAAAAARSIAPTAPATTNGSTHPTAGSNGTACDSDPSEFLVEADAESLLKRRADR